MFIELVSIYNKVHFDWSPLTLVLLGHKELLALPWRIKLVLAALFLHTDGAVCLKHHWMLGWLDCCIWSSKLSFCPISVHPIIPVSLPQTPDQIRIGSNGMWEGDFLGKRWWKGCMLVAIALCNRGRRRMAAFSVGGLRGEGFSRTTINKANEMAVESGERWDGWLGLTHYLIYPWHPCEHSGAIHYFTSSITSHGQGKRPSPHQHPPPGTWLSGFPLWGWGSGVV